jgi:uncharacterized protein (DUF2384 family)
MKDQIQQKIKRKENPLPNDVDIKLNLLQEELIDYGIEVFNKEEDKFQRWMNKPNDSLDKNTPESLLDSIVGIREVKNCLNRIEFGNFA